MRTVRDSNPWTLPWQGSMITNFTNNPCLILTHLKLHHPSHCSGWQSPRWVSLKKITGFSFPFEHHNKYISISVVTFSHWVNYSPIIVTLPSPSYLASQTELLGFIYRGVTPQSSPVEPKLRFELRTYWLQISCSGQLSYSGYYGKQKMGVWTSVFMIGVSRYSLAPLNPNQPLFNKDNK